MCSNGVAGGIVSGRHVVSDSDGALIDGGGHPSSLVDSEVENGDTIGQSSMTAPCSCVCVCVACCGQDFSMFTEGETKGFVDLRGQDLSMSTEGETSGNVDLRGKDSSTFTEDDAEVVTRQCRTLASGENVTDGLGRESVSTGCMADDYPDIPVTLGIGTGGSINQHAVSVTQIGIPSTVGMKIEINAINSQIHERGAETSSDRSCPPGNAQETVPESSSGTNRKLDKTESLHVVNPQACVDAKEITPGADLLNPENLRSAQRADSDISPILNWKATRTDSPDWNTIAGYSDTTKNYCAQWDSLKVVDGLLYQNWCASDGRTNIRQLVIPYNLRKEFVARSHGVLAGGHFGIRRTQHQLQHRAYFMHWRRVVEDFCKNCGVCARFHRGKPPKQSFLKLLNCGAVFERIHTDLSGPYVCSNGFRYLCHSRCLQSLSHCPAYTG